MNMSVENGGVADTALQVGELTSAEVAKWDEYVMRCPEATFFHRAGWKEVIERAMGHQAYFLYAKSGDEIQGVLPLGHIRSRLFGNSLISLPFCVYGGAAVTHPQAREVLENAAQELAGRLNVDYLEIRNLVSRHADWPRKDLYVTFRKEISPDPEENMKSIPRKQRAVVRKAIKAGLTSEMDDGTERLYEAYSQSVHALGTPVFPKSLFTVLREVFGNDCDVLTVTKDGRLVSSVMSFYFKDQVLPYYGGGTAEARALKANDFMYWELMRRSAERGIRIFDYGRSKKGTGSYSFKKNWGFEPEPLHYEFHLVNAEKMPDVSPMNPKYRIFINLWQRMPLPLTKILGPVISRNLG